VNKSSWFVGILEEVTKLAEMMREYKISDKERNQMNASIKSSMEKMMIFYSSNKSEVLCIVTVLSTNVADTTV